MTETTKTLADLKQGDAVARIHNSATPSERVLVERRTPKYLFLSNGDKLHVEGVYGDKLYHRYEVWSDEREAERARRSRYEQFSNRFRRMRDFADFTIDDAMRNEEAFCEFEALVARQAEERAALVAKIKGGA